jgi:hypothetical protein
MLIEFEYLCLHVTQNYIVCFTEVPTSHLIIMDAVY